MWKNFFPLLFRSLLHTEFGSSPYISISYDTHKQIVKIEHTKKKSSTMRRRRKKKMNCWQWSHCRLLKTTNFESRRHHHIVVRYNRKNKRSKAKMKERCGEKKASKPRVKKLRTFCSGCQPRKIREWVEKSKSDCEKLNMKKRTFFSRPVPFISLQFMNKIEWK